jgi:hypothetical protein
MLFHSSGVPDILTMAKVFGSAELLYLSRIDKEVLISPFSMI